jgi:RecA-family ATPase
LSWGAALAASQGGAFLGQYKALEEIHTLYISLEDTERRLSDRLKKLRANTGNDKLRITTQWKDGALGLDNYLAENTETGFVIIDTLGRFIGPGLDDMNDYAATVNAISRIKKIADNRKTPVLLVHHARKGGNSEKDKADWMDAALGSAGIAGSADASIFIAKPRPKDGKAAAPELWATGRDAGDIHHVLKFDADCGWTINTTNPPLKEAPNTGDKKSPSMNKEIL